MSTLFNFAKVTFAIYDLHLYASWAVRVFSVSGEIIFSYPLGEGRDAYLQAVRGLLAGDLARKERALRLPVALQPLDRGVPEPRLARLGRRNPLGLALL